MLKILQCPKNKTSTPSSRSIPSIKTKIIQTILLQKFHIAISSRSYPCNRSRAPLLRYSFSSPWESLPSPCSSALIPLSQYPLQPPSPEHQTEALISRGLGSILGGGRACLRERQGRREQGKEAK
jgi:hypothetical protein